MFNSNDLPSEAIFDFDSCEQSFISFKPIPRFVYMVKSVATIDLKSIASQRSSSSLDVDNGRRNPCVNAFQSVPQL